MKLHLPKQLFTALLSSFVMLLPTAVTLASGAVVFAASVAIGADQQLIESVTWDGTNTTTASKEGTIQVGEENANRDITLTIADGAQIEADWMLLRRGGDVMMTGGQVTLNKLHIHNYNQGGQTEEFVISGGVLTVQNENDFTATATGDRAPVTIGHWSNGGGKLVVSGGKLQVLNGSIYMGHDSYATLQISAGEANVAGLYYNTQQVGSSLELTGGRLNIGSEGIRNTTRADIRKVSLTGGTLGALDNWTLSGVTTTIGTVTIDTDKWDAATGATAVGEDVGVNISLLGNLAAAEGGMAITLAGSGSLTIDHTLNGTVTLKEGSSARLIADITNLAENYTKAYSGIGSTGASGFWLGYNILASGSNVTAYDTEGNNLNLTNGVYGVASDGIFYVNDEVTYSADITNGADRYYVSESGVFNFTSYNLGGENDATNDKVLIGILNKISGPGQVNLASGAIIQTQNVRDEVTLASNYKVAGNSGANLTLTSWKNDSAGVWRTWKVTDGGSLTVGDSGDGTLKILAGQRLSIQNGGQVAVGTLRLGYDGTDTNKDNPGSLVMSGQNSKLTVGGIVMQNGISEAATWLNEVNITGGTLKVTGNTAITYNGANVKTNVTLGGNSAESSVILQTGSANGWSMSKHQNTGSTFNVGYVTIDAGNAHGITFNGATLTGVITNNASLTLGSDVVFGSGALVSNAGTLCLNLGSDNLVLNTYIGKEIGKFKESVVSNTAAANFIIENTGNKTLSGNITLANGGTITLKGGTFGTATSSITQNIWGETSKLVLDGVESYIGGNTHQLLDTNLGLINGTTLHLTGGDVLNYDNATYTTTIGAGSFLDVGANRQSLRSSNNGSVIVLTGGTIYGAGDVYRDKGYVVGLDFYDSGKISVVEDSLIATAMAARDGVDVVTFDVASNKTLTLGSYTDGESTTTAGFYGSGSYLKAGSGTLRYEGTAFSNALTVDAGVFDYYVASDLTHSASVSGSGTLRKSGSGTLTLGSANTSVSKLDVAEGKLIYNATTECTHTLTGVSSAVFEKTGAGELSVSVDVDGAYHGQIVVSEGTLKFTGGVDSTCNDAGRRITIKNGAALDVDGRSRHFAVTMQSGATLTNTGSGTGSTQRQLHTLELEGDATVQGSGNIYLIDSNYAQTDLILNGHTLTKKGENTLFLRNTKVDSAGGTLRVEAGKVATISGNEMDLTPLSLEIGGGEFQLSGMSQSIQALTMEGGTLTVDNGHALTVLGDVALGSGTIRGSLSLTGTMAVSGSVDMSETALSVFSLNTLQMDAQNKPTTSGLQSITYKLWEGSGSITGLSSVSVGSETYAVADGKITTAGTVYYVVEGDTKIAGGASGYSDDTDGASAFVVDGTLNLAGNTSSLTVNEVLSNASGTGTIRITTSGLDTYISGDKATASNFNLTNRFGGTLELASGVAFTLGRADSEKEGTSINMGALSALVLNNGSTLRYNADGKTNIANVHIVGKMAENSSAAGIYFYDSQSANSLQLTGVTRLDGDLNISTTWDGGINIHKLVGGGNLNSRSGTGIFYTKIGALVGNVDGEINAFTGNLTFTGGENRVSVSTGTGYDGTLTFGNLTADNVNSFSFNVQTDTSVAAISTNRGAVTVSNGATLTIRETSSILNLSAAEGVVSVNSEKTLTLSGSANIIGTVNAPGYLFVSADSSLSLVGGSADTLKTHQVNRLAAAGSGTSIELGENAQLSLSDYLDLSKGGDAGGQMTVGAGSSVKVQSSLWMSKNYAILLKEGAQLQHNAVVISGQTGDESFIRSAADTSVSNSDLYSTNSGYYELEKVDVSVNSAGGTTLGNKLSNSSLENSGVGELTVNNSGNTITSLAAINGNVKLSASMEVDSISAKAGKVVTVTNGNTIRMEGGVSISANGADATMTAVSDSAIARLEKDASFTIEDMTLTNTTITAATVDTHVDLKNVSGDVTLKTGIFGVEMTTVGRGGSALTYEEGAPSITLSSTDAGAAKLMISANPTVDVRGSYGTYTLTFNLNLQLDSSLGEPASNEAWGELVGFSGWLGTLLEEQGAVFAGSAGDPVAQSTAPSVSYGYSAGSGGSNVGTLVITINGLNVPEPTTSTLSLLALAGLCARRRRK